MLPAGDLVIQDEFTTGEENYKEFFYALVGIAGEGQNFDGNGMYVRFQTGGGSQPVSLGPSSSNSRRAVRQQHRGAARQPPGVPGQAAAVQARRALLHAEAPGRQRAGGREVRAVGRHARPPRRCKSERDKLRKRGRARGRARASSTRSAPSAARCAEKPK